MHNDIKMLTELFQLACL